MKKTTHAYYTLKQGHIPVFLEEFLSVRDPVIAFDRFVEEIEICKYLKDIPEHVKGRIRDNPFNMLKTALSAFADKRRP